VEPENANKNNVGNIGGWGKTWSLYRPPKMRKHDAATVREGEASARIGSKKKKNKCQMGDKG